VQYALHIGLVDKNNNTFQPFWRLSNWSWHLGYQRVLKEQLILETHICGIDLKKEEFREIENMAISGTAIPTRSATNVDFILYRAFIMIFSQPTFG
jgi:hypothetical protein